MYEMTLTDVKSEVDKALVQKKTAIAALEKAGQVERDDVLRFAKLQYAASKLEEIGYHLDRIAKLQNDAQAMIEEAGVR